MKDLDALSYAAVFGGATCMCGNDPIRQVKITHEDGRWAWYNDNQSTAILVNTVPGMEGTLTGRRIVGYENIVWQGELSGKGTCTSKCCNELGAMAYKWGAQDPVPC